MPFHQIIPSPSTALVFSNELNEGHHDHERLLTSLLFKAVVSVTNKLLQNGGQSLYEVGYLNFVSLLDTYVCISRNFQKYFTVTKKSGDFMKVLTSFVILLLQLSRINSTYFITCVGRRRCYITAATQVYGVTEYQKKYSRTWQ